MTLDAVLARIDDTLPDACDRLLDLLRIASISTDPAFEGDCARAAAWLVQELKSLGFTASARPTPGHPMVVARHAGPGRHILFYGHYDVQPIDPIELWDRDPFDPALEETAKGVVIRGRGAADDKGQLMTFVEACRAWKEVHGTLPGNLTIFFEGEEESGSPSLIPFLKDNAEELGEASLALICDTGMFADKVPAVVTMLRGLAKIEFTLKAADKDLHSGSFGGAAINPIRVLTRILGQLHDAQGRVTVPGFYDDVAELPEAVRAQWQGLGFDHAAFLGGVGLSQPAGEQDRTPLEQIWSRPTAEINGIWGGYTGAGFKTVLPAEASAKVSFRLVSKQDPEKILASFKSWIEAQLPPDVRLEWKAPNGSPASVMAIDDPAFDAARAALTEEWNCPAAFVGCGGSIPIAGYFKDILGMDAMLIGFGKDDDQIHSPNEKYDLESFHKGIRSWARILDRIAG
ncbi:M20/M25/M40 family metallo-hydrolase [Rhodobacter capsulatus]|uniref:Acetylornithine deacetylase/Succinyl-diaminopimelate desuccinylase n=1 Tax=Rhodobacter capsulatus TaxID=1061 RepID=A0A1G7RZL1_RHOCA|nr:M20/M25/M40 family metallo-hydrolase [Rhodobacter capsulatus]WER08026.1 M20/M25/M40 family metallo-hydrolase [Rhodobacter capsulatus]SDG16206.1 Acetylornithine deacetylase/Succinyl-diaminopimelate desuccinylase [Rhodobacter capsulatus]